MKEMYVVIIGVLVACVMVPGMSHIIKSEYEKYPCGDIEIVGEVARDVCLGSWNLTHGMGVIFGFFVAFAVYVLISHLFPQKEKDPDDIKSATDLMK